MTKAGAGASRETVLALPDKAELPVPNYLFQDLSFLETDPGTTVIQGWNPTDTTTFVFISRVKIPGEDYNPLRDLRGTLGVDELNASLSDPESSGDSNESILRINSVPVSMLPHWSEPPI